jgi:hypothetical protein
MPAPLLSVVDDVAPGRWIAISSLDASRRVGLASGATVERLTAALFGVLPISAATATPLIGWLADPGDNASIDAFYTVQGTARDAERRTIEMLSLTAVPDDAWHAVDAVITVDAPQDFVFFVCVGGREPHTVVDLLRERVTLAA